MLWYKGWLETRYKLWMTLGIMGFILFLQYSHGPGSQNILRTIISYSNPILVLMTCAIFGGAGIATQPSLKTAKGLHGSMLFTLCLPVSRLRLLAVRAGIGWLEVIGMIGTLCCGMLFLSPFLRATIRPVEMFEYAGTLIACASAIYFLSVLLATFLDDQWRVWGTMIVSAALSWLSNHLPFLAPVDIFRAMGKNSPLIAHTMPWTAMTFALGLALILFFASLKIVRTREY